MRRHAYFVVVTTILLICSYILLHFILPSALVWDCTLEQDSISWKIAPYPAIDKQTACHTDRGGVSYASYTFETTDSVDQVRDFYINAFAKSTDHRPMSGWKRLYEGTNPDLVIFARPSDHQQSGTDTYKIEILLHRDEKTEVSINEVIANINWDLK